MSGATILNRFAAAVCGLALCAGAADAAGIGRSIAERYEVRSTPFFRFGFWQPTGQELKDGFGPRIPLGVELRAVSRYGVGADITLDCWWAFTGEEQAMSVFLPLSAGLFYSYPLLDSAITPYAGLCATLNYGSLCFAQGDSVARGRGLGAGGGAMLGVEVPLLRSLTVRLDTRLIGGRISAAFDDEESVLAAERRDIKVGSFSAALGLTMGFTDLFFW
jgi:hypothetical protein